MKNLTAQALQWMLVGSVCLFIGCNDSGDGGGWDGTDFGDNNINVVTAMGDSITAYGNPPYPSILAGMIGKTVINRGQGGAKSSSGADQVASALAADQPAFLLILYGANDVIHGYSHDSVIANLRTMISAARANQTVPILATLTPMSGSHVLWAGDASALSDEIRSLASQEQVSLADLEKAFGSDPTLISDDGLHPSQAGYEKIAEVFADILQ